MLSSADASHHRIRSAPASRALAQQQQQAGQEVPAQVRCFAAHYAGDEGLARPFSAAPSDRNLAWGDTPGGLEQLPGPTHRHRHEASRQTPMHTAAPMAQQVMLQLCFAALCKLAHWTAQLAGSACMHQNCCEAPEVIAVKGRLPYLYYSNCNASAEAW